MKIKSFAATSRIVDREKDIAQIIDLFHHAECTQVHIVYAETGYGKSSFSAKLAKLFVISLLVISCKWQSITCNLQRVVKGR